MVLLSTHNICFGWEIRKLNFRYTLITIALNADPDKLLMDQFSQGPTVSSLMVSESSEKV